MITMRLCSLWVMLVLVGCLPDPTFPRTSLPPPPDVQYFDTGSSACSCSELNQLYAGPPLPSISCEDLSARGELFTCRDAPQFVASLYEGTGAPVCTMRCHDTDGQVRELFIRSVEIQGVRVFLYAAEKQQSADGTLFYMPFQC